MFIAIKYGAFMTIKEMTKHIQRAIGVMDDGLYGPETASTLYRHFYAGDTVPEHHPAHKSSVADISVVDDRSEKNIQTLLPQVGPYARSLIHALADRGLVFKVTSGLRTAAEQDALYAIGRTKPDSNGKWNKVTNAKAWQSVHNYGLAFDLTQFKTDGKLPIYDGSGYAVAGAIGESMGLSWGGSWGDEPHYAYRPVWADNLSEKAFVAELRRRHEAGESVA